METRINSENAIFMETERELNSSILKITMSIAEKFPELSKYIGEIPVKFSSTADPGTDIKNLHDYYDSLNSLLKKYAVDHNSTIRCGSK